MMTLLLALSTFAMPAADAAAPIAPSLTVAESAMLSDAMRRGQLNTGEINVLQADIERIGLARKAAVRDGRVTRYEQAKIDRLVADFRADYARLTHNHLRR